MGCNLPPLNVSFKLPPLPFAVALPKVPALPKVVADLAHGLKLPPIPGLDAAGNAIAGVAAKLGGLPALTLSFKSPPLPFEIKIPKIPKIPTIPIPYCPFGK